MCARNCGFDRAIVRYNKDKVYGARMDPHGADNTTMQKWDSLFLEREKSPLPTDRAAYQQRQWIYARWVADQLRSAVGTWRHTTGTTNGDIEGPDDGCRRCKCLTQCCHCFGDDSAYQLLCTPHWHGGGTALNSGACSTLDVWTVSFICIDLARHVSCDACVSMARLAQRHSPTQASAALPLADQGHCVRA